VRFLPLQRSPVALRCLGLPNPRRSRFSLALRSRHAPSARAGEWRLLRFSAAVRVEVSRSRPPRTSPRQLTLPVAVTMGGKSRGSRLGGTTWSSFGFRSAQWRRNPDGSTTLLGFMPFAVLILPAGQTDVSIRLRPPAFHPNVHPGLCDFLTPGDRPLFSHASGRSMAQPPARRRICTERPITNVQARLLGLLRQSSRAARAIVPVAVRYCPGLCLLQVCGHQPVCMLRLDAKHAVSPGTKLQTPSRLQASFPLPGPYAHELRRPFGL